VENTAFDFRTAKPIGKDIKADNEQISIAGGYDHTFVIETDKTITWNHGIKLSECAVLCDKASGRKLTVYTDAPGIQVYSGNFMGDAVFKGGVQSKKHGAICLETGFYPDTPNRPDFPSCIYGPDKDYECVAVFKFEIA
jgi:aldose 1-epimerase